VRRHVWWSPSARRVIEVMSAKERERFDVISAYLAVNPFPSKA
jgi:hypothetical protein